MQQIYKKPANEAGWEKYSKCMSIKQNFTQEMRLKIWRFLDYSGELTALQQAVKQQFIGSYFASGFEFCLFQAHSWPGKHKKLVLGFNLYVHLR